MLDSGNNANIRPNMRMYYLETILPIVRKLNAAYSRFFGFVINRRYYKYSSHNLSYEIKQLLSSLVNAGIITPNEARTAMNFDELPMQMKLESLRILQAARLTQVRAVDQ